MKKFDRNRYSQHDTPFDKNGDTHLERLINAYKMAAELGEILKESPPENYDRGPNSSDSDWHKNWLRDASNDVGQLIVKRSCEASFGSAGKIAPPQHDSGFRHG